jgi:hypothetical protein
MKANTTTNIRWAMLTHLAKKSGFSRRRQKVQKTGFGLGENPLFVQWLWELLFNSESEKLTLKSQHDIFFIILRQQMNINYHEEST